MAGSGAADPAMFRRGPSPQEMPIVSGRAAHALSGGSGGGVQSQSRGYGTRALGDRGSSSESEAGPKLGRSYESESESESGASSRSRDSTEISGGRMPHGGIASIGGPPEVVLAPRSAKHMLGAGADPIEPSEPEEHNMHEKGVPLGSSPREFEEGDTAPALFGGGSGSLHAHARREGEGGGGGYVAGGHVLVEPGAVSSPRFVQTGNGNSSSSSSSSSRSKMPQEIDPGGPSTTARVVELKPGRGLGLGLGLADSPG